MARGLYIDLRSVRVGRAKDCLLRAAAALTEMSTPNELAFALLEAADGLRRLAQIDESGEAHTIVRGWLRSAKRR